MNQVTYKISTYPSRYGGYHSKKKDIGNVKSYISTIFNHSTNFDDFVKKLNLNMILERICLERGFQKVRMKERCIEFTYKPGKKSIVKGIEMKSILEVLDGYKFPCKMMFFAVVMIIKT